jgi:hypothetical protein
LTDLRLRLAMAALLTLSLPLPANAQDYADYAPDGDSAAQAAPVYTQEQLDQMLAPIALYPDTLLAQILMASTYPLEVVEAQRWLQNRQNAALRGDQLAAALMAQPWDPSVKALVPFPHIVAMMDNNLQWTEQLGDAFLAQQPAVMDSVQQLRQRAQVAGSLQSTPQQVVTEQGDAIEIQPASADAVYVPYYNPAAVYGAWPYPDYQPYYFPPPNGYDYNGALLGFGIAAAIIAPLWGWEHWDWHHRHIAIDDDRYRRINQNRSPAHNGVWQHDPTHRHGVPYNSPAVRGRFDRTPQEARRSLRGYDTARPAATQAARPETSMMPRRQEQSGRAVRPAPQPPVTPMMRTNDAPRTIPHENRPETGGRMVKPNAQPPAARVASPMVQNYACPSGTWPTGKPRWRGRAAPVTLIVSKPEDKCLR